jgi:hypothetical protein
VPHGELEAVAVLEVADPLVDVVVLMGTPEVRPRDEALGAGHRELRLEDEAPVLLGSLHGHALVHQEDRRDPRPRRDEPPLGLGNGSKDDANRQPPGVLDGHVETILSVEGERHRVLVGGAGPRRPTVTSVLRRGRLATRSPGARGCLLRRRQVRPRTSAEGTGTSSRSAPGG